MEPELLDLFGALPTDIIVPWIVGTTILEIVFSFLYCHLRSPEFMKPSRASHSASENSSVWVAVGFEFGKCVRERIVLQR